MANFRAYWDGVELAEITAEQVEAPALKSGAGVGGCTIPAMQKAFDTYYQGMAIAKGLRMPEGAGGAFQAAFARIKKSIIDDLQASARTGWGHGVNDLEEAFEHLADNGGRWTDGNVRMYGGGPSGSGAINGHGCFTTAQFAANFFWAIDERVKKTQEAASEHVAKADKMATMFENNPNWNKNGTKEWGEFGEVLKSIEKNAERVASSMWIFGSQRADDISEHIETGNQLLTAANEVRGAVEMYDQGMRAGFGAGGSAALVVAKRAADAIPVLGELYGEVIGMIPGIAVSFQAIAERQRSQMMIAKYGPGVGQGMTW
jgi:hypothetical protein